MANGRGAWTANGKDNGSVYYQYISGKPADGSTPDKGEAYRAVNLGVRAIQTAINDLGYSTPLTADGVLGPKSQDGIKWAQSKLGTASDGQAGPGTCRALWRPYIVKAANKHGIDGKYLLGQIVQESVADPGAQGWSNSHDHGLVQINLDSSPDISWEQAHDPAFALDWSAGRLAAAMKKYSSKGQQLQIAAMIAQHNSPLWADQWFKSGSAPNSTIAEYVSRTLAYADQYW